MTAQWFQVFHPDKIWSTFTVFLRALQQCATQPLLCTTFAYITLSQENMKRFYHEKPILYFPKLNVFSCFCNCIFLRMKTQTTQCHEGQFPHTPPHSPHTPPTTQKGEFQSALWFGVKQRHRTSIRPFHLVFVRCSTDRFINQILH